MTSEDTARFARMLRETAELVELGVVHVARVDVAYGHRVDDSDLIPRRRLTGEQTVTIQITGYPNAAAAGWRTSENLPAPQPELRKIGSDG